MKKETGLRKNIYFDQDTSNILNYLAKKEGLSMSSVVDKALIAYLNQSQNFTEKKLRDCHDFLAQAIQDIEIFRGDWAEKENPDYTKEDEENLNIIWKAFEPLMYWSNEKNYDIHPGHFEELHSDLIEREKNKI